MPQRNIFILLVVLAVSLLCYVRGGQNPYARYVASTYREIDRTALDDVPDETLFDGAIRGMVDVLRDRGDTHSLFIAKEDAKAFLAELSQEFGGIGVRIRFLGDPPQLTVVEPPEPGTPAFHADIRTGDIIAAVDGEPTVDWTMSQVLQHIRGEPGEPIHLSILHPGEQKPVGIPLIREIIPVPSILGDRRTPDGRWVFLLDDDPRMIYVRITAFGNKTATELSDTLKELTKRGGQALILDLRENAGGALPSAVAVSNMFLTEGLTIVETRKRDGQVHERYLSAGGDYQKLPVAVLINRNSASASEIVAACLQDHDRAVVIGERSFGKGTVQRLIEVESGRSLLKLTSASFWRPDGQNIHRMPGATEDEPWGVRPNSGFDVPMSDQDYIAYRKYRNGRDQIKQPNDTESSEEGNESDEVDFVDRTRELAVRHLQKVLDGEPSDVGQPL